MLHNPPPSKPATGRIPNSKLKKPKTPIKDSDLPRKPLPPKNVDRAIKCLDVKRRRRTQLHPSPLQAPHYNNNNLQTRTPQIVIKDDLPPTPIFERPCNKCSRDSCKKRRRGAESFGGSKAKASEEEDAAKVEEEVRGATAKDPIVLDLDEAKGATVEDPIVVVDLDEVVVLVLVVGSSWERPIEFGGSEEEGYGSGWWG